MGSRNLPPEEVAKLIQRADKIVAYFRELAGRGSRAEFASDPLKIAANDMLQAAEKYQSAVWAIGKAAGLDNPYPHDEPSDDSDDSVNGLEAARAFILLAFRRNPKLPEIAAIAFLSPCHFHRRFHARYGQTPKELLRELQIAEAQRLISNGVTLAKAPRMCGFANQSHMTSYFKKHVGQTPGRWLREVGPAPGAVRGGVLPA